MKTLDEYMKAPYRMEIVADPSEGDYVASFPELPGCRTCGETLEQAIANAQAASRSATGRTRTGPSAAAQRS